jgi:6-pyruvoyltetrahydropterin/6-carboxytetrahydropterin synthase
MFEVRVEAEFAAAHFLKDYHGKCENLHGHNYAVFAHARGKTLDEGGMLIDFSQLKKALRLICGSLDHTNLNDLAEFSQNPSAERIAHYIFLQLYNEMQKISPSYADFLYAVDVYETPTSRARYIKD